MHWCLAPRRPCHAATRSLAGPSTLACPQPRRAGWCGDCATGAPTRANRPALAAPVPPSRRRIILSSVSTRPAGPACGRSPDPGSPLPARGPPDLGRRLYPRPSGAAAPGPCPSQRTHPPALVASDPATAGSRRPQALPGAARRAVPPRRLADGCGRAVALGRGATRLVVTLGR
jgi:hypothetical protein